MALGLIKGPSKCAPKTWAPSVPSSLAFFIAVIDFNMSSADIVIVVGVNEVVPYLQMVLEISFIASNVPSIVSYPPAPCIWMSINPGATYKPLQSMTESEEVVFGFISLIIPFSINIEPFSILSRKIILQFFNNILNNLPMMFKLFIISK